MLGKNAARAAPISALAAFSLCSAASTSGRLTSKSEAIPQKSPHKAGLDLRQRPGIRRNRYADQKRQRVPVQLARSLQYDPVSPSLIQQCFRLHRIQLDSEPTS